MMVILASVPLSDAPWQALGEGEVIAVSQGQIATRHSGDVTSALNGTVL
jgi:hypothetical protein